MSSLTIFKQFLTAVESRPTAAEIDKQIEKLYPEQSFLSAIKSFLKKRRPTETILEILPRLYKVFRIRYKKKTTLSKKLSIFRQIIKENQSAEAYTKSKYDIYFNLPENERNAITNAYTEQVEQRNKNLIQVNKIKVMNAIRKLEKTNDKYQLGVLLMVCSGMRSLELFKNIVEPVEDKPNYVKISNLAKKRDDTSASVQRPLILLTATEFIKKLKKFRTQFTNNKIFTPDNQLNAYITVGLNKATREAFPEVGDSGQASAMLRKYYAVLAYDIFGDKTKQNFNIFIKDVLGHADSVTSFSYSTIHLDESEPVEQEPEPQPTLPPPTPERTYTKLGRNDTRDQKLALLQTIYNDHGGIIKNAKLRELSGVGSRIVNDFLKNQ